MFIELGNYVLIKQLTYNFNQTHYFPTKFTKKIKDSLCGNRNFVINLIMTIVVGFWNCHNQISSKICRFFSSSSSYEIKDGIFLFVLTYADCMAKMIFLTMLGEPYLNSLCPLFMKQAVLARIFGTQ